MKITAQWDYDHVKRMASRDYSPCCGVNTTTKRMLHNKVDTTPFKTGKTVEEKKTKIVYDKFLRIFKKKRVVKYIVKSYASPPPYTYASFCNKCGKKTKVLWQFKHNVGVSEGQRLVSKTKRVGSTPATPAKRKALK